MGEAKDKEAKWQCWSYAMEMMILVRMVDSGVKMPLAKQTLVYPVN